MRKIILFLYILALFFPISTVYAQNQDEKEDGPYLSYEIYANKSAIVPGSAFHLVIQQNIHPEWHTYWKNPGDSGNPSIFNWEVRDGFEIGEPQFPAPEYIPTGPLATFGYEDEVLYVFHVKAPETLSGDSIEISADIEALVCKEICIPEFHSVSLTLPVSATSSPASQDIFETARSRMPEQVDWPARYSEDNGKLVLTIQPGSDQKIEEILTARKIHFFPEEWGLLSYTDAPVVMQTGPEKIALKFKRDTRSLTEIENLEGLVSVHSGDGRSVYAVSARPDPAAAQEEVSQPMEPAGERASPIGAEVGFLSALVLAVMGGVILNLMPCVFPVLSMKALSLSKLGGKHQREARLHGISYTAGILVMFGIVGGVLFALKSAGSEIGWGFQFQNSLVVLGLAYLLYLIGLNLAGFFEIPARFTGMGQSLTQKQGHTGSFMTGLLATIVATPCTAPFMGAALGYAVTQPAFTGMLIFLALGVGLALPYLALCFIPALRSAMPKPGAWMDVFKQFLSFPMFASAVWLIWVLSIQTGPQGVLVALSGVTGLTFAIWLMQNLPARKGLWRLFLTILAFVVFASVVFAGWSLSLLSAPAGPGNNGGAEITANANYDAFSNDRLDDLLKGKDPVFVNMTAAWCITCKVNERVALNTQKVRSFFEERNIQYLKGDWTNYDKNISRYLEKFGRSGVPIYVYYGGPDEESGQRPEPVVLPQILTPAIVIETIRGSE